MLHGWSKQTSLQTERELTVASLSTNPLLHVALSQAYWALGYTLRRLCLMWEMSHNSHALKHHVHESAVRV